jgi:MFS family permease
MVAGHGAVPWRAFRASGSLWLLCLMYLCVNYGWYFNITYLPAYVHERFPHDEPSMLLAIYQGAPLWVGAAGCLAGGVLADRLARRWADRRRARRLLCSSSLALAAACWCAAIVAPNVHAFCLAVSSAAFLNDLMMASAWTACQDMGRRFAGITAACMNTVGTCGSALSGWLTGTLVHASLAAQADQLQEGIGELPRSVAQAAELAGYDQSFATYAAAYVVAALCWQLIDSTRPIAPANAEPEITSPPGGEV